MRSLPDPGFAGDDGSASPEVLAALTSYAEAPDARYAATLAVVQHARLLVPVVAVLGEVEVDPQGLARDKTSDMAAVLMRGRDGRTALLAFSGTEALRRWNPEARPGPVTAATAAIAAVQDGAEALLVDLAGPASYVVDGDDLARLASGWRLVALGDGERHGWIGPSAE